MNTSMLIFIAVVAIIMFIFYKKSAAENNQKKVSADISQKGNTNPNPSPSAGEPFQLMIEDIFEIKDKGIIATGKISSGTIRVGDTVQIEGKKAKVSGIETFHKQSDIGVSGENVGLVLSGIEKEELKSGQVIFSAV